MSAAGDDDPPSGPGGLLLQAYGLTRRFGAVLATDQASLALHAGEVHALIGPNGAGKTTLIHQLSGALEPDAGRIELRGHDITALPVHQRVKAGLVRSFQVTNVFRSFSVLDNMALAIQAARQSPWRFWRAAREDHAVFEQARVWLASTGLLARERAVAGELAHGEQRQLEVALALAAQPGVLLLDEPMAGLGPGESERMLKLLTGLRGKVAVLLVEHDMDTVFRLADRISVLVAGRVIASGTPAQVRADPQVRAAYLGSEA